ncbi:hypothetical protein K1T71_009199 [Dendrolimus kikuchii]|uniref:Uncharacterized protein n=1 Tax=Dendrolimus kikuchii TaxID=765133 RepID=A0ACC1CTR8_9NEOP|nr:hypothetical protein K1T71_009199 [Dendrolimus kikuchii]
MDGSSVEHSDSDSGESWTLLDHIENTPAYADDAPVIQQTEIDQERSAVVQNNEKDDDTDGISIISDSEPELTPCEISYDKCLLADEPQQENTQYFTTNPQPISMKDNKCLRSDDDFLGDSHGKHKTYVHRRNKRLSTVLNIIMLGSVITAAGVAIGHMWGARNDCAMHTTPTVNKILSNLYKLQEENAYLRSKLKELTFMTNTQFQKKSGLNKLPVKQPKCRKIYEESLDKKITDVITKCVDNENKMYSESILESHLIQPKYEKDFISDLDKLKSVYKQNKSWLDDEVAKRMKNEKETIKKMKNSMKGINLSPVDEETIEFKDEILNIIDTLSHTTTFDKNADNHSENSGEMLVDNKLNKIPTEKKITYADSLKSDEHIKKHEKRDTKYNFDKEHFRRKSKKQHDLPPEVIKSEEDLIKDDRYIEPKIKQQRKKYDHQKLHKKQKRRNKYEQWEMKGGIMKDYDTLSMTSEDNEHVLRSDQSHINRDFENKNDRDLFMENDIPKVKTTNAEHQKYKPEKHSTVDKGSEKKGKDVHWYEKRATLRTEARRKLELELFGENSPNSGGWYFRRMQRREQCRAKADNTTFRKQSKRNMNFKMKH